MITRLQRAVLIGIAMALIGVPLLTKAVYGSFVPHVIIGVDIICLLIAAGLYVKLRRVAER